MPRQSVTACAAEGHTRRLLADHSDIGRVTLASFGPIDAAHVLVTDPAAPRAFLTRLRQRVVEVMGAGRRGQ